MTKLICKIGEIDSPYDQYQVYTDSIAMLCSFANGILNISDQWDGTVLNYTGPDTENSTDKDILIYDSNKKGFTMKWWSNYNSHIYFPKDDWCIEKYEANQFSEGTKPHFEILMNTPKKKEGNPYLGTWRLIDTYSKSIIIADTVMVGEMEYIDILKNDKDYLNNLIKKAKLQNPTYCTFTPSQMLHIRSVSDRNMHSLLNKVSYNDNGFVLNSLLDYTVTWLSDNCIVTTCVDPKGNTMHDILVREDDNVPPIGKIASFYISR